MKILAILLRRHGVEVIPMLPPAPQQSSPTLLLSGAHSHASDTRLPCHIHQGAI